jgi:HK97 gp10 family phage protein
MAAPVVGLLGRMAAGAVTRTAMGFGEGGVDGGGVDAHIKIDGDKELLAKFKSLGRGFREDVLVAAVMAGAEIIQDEAIARAPVRSGNLRDNIVREPLKGRRDFGEVGVSWRVRRGVSGIGQRSNHPAFYGVMVEKGTGPRSRKSGGSTGTMPEQPFLGPAYDATKDSAQRKVKEELSDLIRKKVQGDR